MFFLLQKRVPEKGTNHWNQLGIVVAESADDAIEKIELKKMERVQHSITGISIFLNDGKGNEYLLESIEEITSMPQ